MPVRRSTIASLCVALLASMLSVMALSSAAAPASAQPAAKASASSAARVVGRPPHNYVIPATSFFSFPNTNGADRMAIRNRVLETIRSVWGGPKTPRGMTYVGNGTIRIATWSFNDWEVAHSLVAAQHRGVSVQIVAAKSANKDHAPWRWLRKQLGPRLYIPSKSGSRDKVSFARECRGSCRGAGGTPHSKYFMFTNVGSSHVPNVVVQSSMNLTTMGYKGQWNQAEVSHSKTVYDQFMVIYRQTRVGRPVKATYRTFQAGNITNMFFPLHHGTASSDPVMTMLNRTRCTGATAGGTANGRTKIRIINYSIYGDRGVWIAKKLRRLWNAGCDIRIIYAVSSRPVISILRNGSGRGGIPVRQSVITNGKREIVKYNHSKWMTITGNWGPSTASFQTMSGSANYSLFAFTGDEQVQTIDSRAQATRHMGVFNRTWSQRTSHQPGFGIKGSEARMTEAQRIALIPKEPTWGKGIYKYLTPEGE